MRRSDTIRATMRRSAVLLSVPACAALIAFSLGACIDSAVLDPQAGAGGGTGECAADELACAGSCVRPDIDPANCGDCGVACTADWVCQAGHCAEGCAAGTVECAGGCVDTSSDALHCGDCDKPCADGEVCVGGTCSPECPEGTEKCGSSCVDTTSDPDHCGSCIKDCAPEDQCDNSECKPLCGPGTANCNGECVNLAVNPDHCGACNNACASGQCGTTLSATMAMPPSSWSFNGDAYHDGTTQSAVLTPPTASQLGTFFYKYPIEIDELTLSFEFRIGGGSGNGGDGMAFALQSNANNAIGFGGGGFGVTGLNGYGIELDTFDNNQSCTDPGNNHAAVVSLAQCGMEGVPTALMTYPTLPFNLNDGQWHVMNVSIANSAMSMSLDSVPIASQVALPNFAPGTPYFVGFGAAAGLQFDRHEVRNITLTVPTVRCM